MSNSISISEVLRRVLKDSDDEFSSSGDEVIGDIKIDDQQHVWNRPGWRCSQNTNVEPCQLETALLNDDEVGEASNAIFFLQLFCINFTIAVM